MRAKQSLDEVLLTSLWQHQSLKKQPNELEWHTKLCLRSLTNAKRVLLLGAAALHFTDVAAANTAGVWLEKVTLLPGKQVMTGPSLKEVAHNTVGEFRLCLERFFQE